VVLRGEREDPGGPMTTLSMSVSPVPIGTECSTRHSSPSLLSRQQPLLHLLHRSAKHALGCAPRRAEGWRRGRGAFVESHRPLHEASPVACSMPGTQVPLSAS
jgi:hypothetical protein